MSEIKFVNFNQVDPKNLLPVVNKQVLISHLVEHPYFNTASLQVWMEDKMKVNAVQECRIRAIYIGGLLAGWCGIQLDDNDYKVAIVISRNFFLEG